METVRAETGVTIRGEHADCGSVLHRAFPQFYPKQLQRWSL